MYLNAVPFYLEQRLATNTSVLERKGNVDVFESAIFTEAAAGQDGGDAPTLTKEEIALCHLYVALPFTDGTSTALNPTGSYEGAVAIALAAQHWNTGSASVIPELSNIPQSCPIKFSLEIQDTELRESTAVDAIIDATGRPTNSPEQVLPSAILGAARSVVSIPTSIITSLRGFPQISAISTSVALNDKALYPLFGRTIPDDSGTAVPVIQYLSNILHVQYLAVIYVNDSYGSAYVQNLQSTARAYAPNMRIQQFDIPRDAARQDIQRTIQSLKNTENTFFFGIVFPTSIFDMVMEEAYYAGIAGTGQHNWIYSDVTGDYIVSRPFPRDSPLSKSFLGAGLIFASAGLPEYNPKLGSLTQQLQNLRTSPADMEYIHTQLFAPLAERNTSGLDDLLQGPDFLQSPGMMGPFLYDATIGLGLAACEVYSTEGSLVGARHFEQLLATQFQGTSGRIELDPETGTRNPTTAFFALTNHVVDTIRSNKTHVQYKQVMTNIFQQGQWEELEPYTFNDVTSTVPSDLPPVVLDENHLSTGLRTGGLLMCGCVLTLAGGFATWTTLHYKTRVVRASQPIFLYMICAGSAILGSTIVPLSIDDGVASIQGCHVACASIPWLLSIGFSLIFCSMFTKTWRINRIYASSAAFKRVRVTVFDVAKPMIILLGLNVIVLIAWTVLSPLEWRLEVEDRDAFGRPMETFGLCYSDRVLPYAITLMVLNLGALCFCVQQAYQARRISLEYAESEYIFKSMMSILMFLLIGIPVLILAQDNREAYFFVSSAIIFLSSSFILLLIFLPKVQYLKKQKNTKKSPTVSGIDSQVTLNEDTTEVEDAEGIKILSYKTQEELIRENLALRKRLLSNTAGVLLSKSEGMICSIAEESALVNDGVMDSTSGDPLDRASSFGMPSSVIPESEVEGPQDSSSEVEILFAKSDEESLDNDSASETLEKSASSKATQSNSLP